MRTGLPAARDIDSLTLDDYIAYVNASVADPFKLGSDLRWLKNQAATFADAGSLDAHAVIRGAAHSPIELLITDPEGRRLGFDPLANGGQGGHYDEIPDSFYGRTGLVAGLDEDLNPPAADDSPLEFEIGEAMRGQYILTVFAIGNGGWSVDFGVDDGVSFAPFQYQFDGVAVVGAEPSSFAVNVTTVPETNSLTLLTIACLFIVCWMVRRDWHRRHILSR
jgi:hypothetical protein